MSIDIYFWSVALNMTWEFEENNNPENILLLLFHFNEYNHTCFHEANLNGYRDLTVLYKFYIYLKKSILF